MIRIRKCVVDGCESDVDAKLCRWPRSPRISDVWLDILRPYSSGLVGLPRHCLREKVVCSKHFELKWFTRGNRHWQAVPSLFTVEEISTRQQKFNNYSISTVKLDHDYALTLPHNAPHETNKRQLSPSQVEDLIKTLTTVNIEHSYAQLPHKKIKLNTFHTDANDTNPPSSGSNSHRVFENLNTNPAMDSNTLDEMTTTSECIMPETTCYTTPCCSRNPNRTSDTKTSRKRLVKSVQNLTPRCKKMYKKCSTLLKSRRRIVQSYKERFEKAEQLNQKKSFSELVEQLRCVKLPAKAPCENY